MKDGGDESSVTGYWLFEIKCLFSIVLLKFDGESRDMYHNHAFWCWNWLIKGNLFEDVLHFSYYSNDVVKKTSKHYKPSWKPFFIGRDRMHQVSPDPLPTWNNNQAWVISFRSRWKSGWNEYNPNTGVHTTLKNGRIITKSSVTL